MGAAFIAFGVLFAYVYFGVLGDFGFDVVDAGPLRESWRIEPDTPGYGPRRTADELRNDLAVATRQLHR